MFHSNLFILIFYCACTASVQNSSVPTKICDNRIPEIDTVNSDSNSDTFDDSYLDPLIAVADIDTFYVEEGLDVNLM